MRRFARLTWVASVCSLYGPAQSPRITSAQSSGVTPNVVVRNDHAGMTYLNWRATQVVRYFFHVMGGNLPIEDDDGTLFSDTSDAVAHAAMVANDLANDDQYDGHAVVVVDVCENLIARVPIIRSQN